MSKFSFSTFVDDTHFHRRFAKIHWENVNISQNVVTQPGRENKWVNRERRSEKRFKNMCVVAARLAQQTAKSFFCELSMKGDNVYIVFTTFVRVGRSPVCVTYLLYIYLVLGCVYGVLFFFECSLFGGLKDEQGHRPPHSLPSQY